MPAPGDQSASLATPTSADQVIELRRPPDSRPRSAPGLLSGKRDWLLVALILALGLFLRLHDYTQAPKLADNQDELAWTWAGLSLLEDHSPTSWSYLLAYPHVFAIPEPDNGQLLPGVHPWLDHPPLFAVLMGGYAWLAGERHFQDVSVAVIRLPVIMLSLLTLLLGQDVAGMATDINKSAGRMRAGQWHD